MGLTGCDDEDFVCLMQGLSGSPGALPWLRPDATQADAVPVEAAEEEGPDVESPVMVASQPATLTSQLAAARAASEAQLVD